MFLGPGILENGKNIFQSQFTLIVIYPKIFKNATKHVISSTFFEQTVKNLAVFLCGPIPRTPFFADNCMISWSHDHLY